MRGRITYIDALKILGVGNKKTLGVIDRLLGAGILAVAAVGQPGVLALLSVRDELVSLSQPLLSGLGQRVRGASGKNRSDLLAAAHAVVAMNAYFGALSRIRLPFESSALKLTPEDELALAGGPRRAESGKLVDALLRTPLPLPTSYRPYEQTVLDMRVSYTQISERLIKFVEGLALWDTLDETKRHALRVTLLRQLPDNAIESYDEKFRQLATDCPEFYLWIYLKENAANRVIISEIDAKLETGLVGLRQLLDDLKANHPPARWPETLVRAYRAQLQQPIAETSPGEALAGLTIPTLSAGYVTPRFQVTEYMAEARPSEESWWDGKDERDDISKVIAGYLTAPVASEVPMVILGQPGSGKSLLTKVLAASLPPEDYLPIRVELRHVSAEAPLLDQIESALRRSTTEHMEWPDLVREAPEALPVIMLDGFDELLQAGMSQSNYLLQVRDFQRREAEQGRRAAFIVTSRTVVANRVRFVPGTVIAKLVPFSDHQVNQWLKVWNETNEEYFAESVSPLTIEYVLPHRELAEQPLLLLMLSFYDADGNALQRRSTQLGRTDLYEGLLTKFVDREIERLFPFLDEHERRRERDIELQQLSIVALAMFNRGKRSVTERDLDADISELLPVGNRDSSSTTRMARRLSRAQLVVARFFFIHQSQAFIDESRLSEYEFLHSTFGEYLVARLVSNSLTRLVKMNEADKPGLSLRSRSELADDEIWDLLSFTPLSDDSQAVVFLAELIHRFNKGQVRRLREVLQLLFINSVRIRQQGYGTYEPRRLNTPARHAAYSANLLVLNVLAVGELRASALFEDKEEVIDQWRSFALLWRSQLDPAGWDALVNLLEVVHIQDRSRRDLIIRRPREARVPPFELFRTAHRPKARMTGEDEGEITETPGISASKTAAQIAFQCVPELELLLHGLQPLLRRIPDAFGLLTEDSDGEARSLMHQILATLVDSADVPDKSDNRKMLIDYLRTRVGGGSKTRVGIHGYDASLLAGFYWPESLRWPEPTKNTLSDWRTIGIIGAVHSPPPPISTIPYPFEEVAQEIRKEGAAFPLLQLYLTYGDDAQGRFSLPELPSVEKVYSEINPVQLAKSSAAFISQTIRFAQERNLKEWASITGIATLVSLAPEKLRKIPADQVNYVLSAGAEDDSQAEIVLLIRKRFTSSARFLR